MLSLLGELDQKLRTAVDDFDFNTYVRVLSDFCNEDLSAFYFDIRKDSLYCDAAVRPEAPRLPHRPRHPVPCPGPLARAGAGVHQRRGLGHALSEAAPCTCSSGQSARKVGRCATSRAVDRPPRARSAPSSRSPNASSRSAATRSSAPASKPKSRCRAAPTRRCSPSCSSPRQSTKAIGTW